MSVYGLFRDTAAWAAAAGAGETYPGVQNLGSPTTITVRDLGVRQVRIAEDVLQRRVWWVLPANAVKPGDTMDTVRVTQVDEAKDAAGNVVHRVVYGDA